MSRNAVGKLVVFAIKVLCATVMIVAAIFTVFTVGPAIETRFFPAVSKLRITSMMQSADGGTIVQAEFTKLRACEYLGLAWYRGTPDGGFERVPVVLLRKAGDTSSPNRPTGFQRAGPWIIGLPPSEIEHDSFAQLSHRCHPFWVTTTNFYP